jgi:hypothetical protein
MSVSCAFVRCKVEVSSTSRSHVQKSPTECDVVMCVIRSKNNPLHIKCAGSTLTITK